MAKGPPPTRDVSSTHQMVGVITRGQSVTVADEAAAPPPPDQAEDTLRAPTVKSAAVNHPESVPMHVALDQVSDEVLEQKYRCRYLHSQSANRSFNRDEYYARALANDPPARSDSAASTPTWFPPVIPRMQAAEAAVVAVRTMMAMIVVVHQVVSRSRVQPSRPQWPSNDDLSTHSARAHECNCS